MQRSCRLWRSGAPWLRHITTDTLRVNKSPLIGKELKKYFSGFGAAIGTVPDYLLEHDAYRLEYSDIIPFHDILKLLPVMVYTETIFQRRISDHEW